MNRTIPTKLELHFLRLIVAKENPLEQGSVASAAIGRLVKLGCVFDAVNDPHRDPSYPTLYQPTELGLEFARYEPQ